MPRSATKAHPKKTKRPAPEKAKATAPEKPKPIAPKKAKPAPLKKATRTSAKKTRRTPNKAKQTSVAAMQAEISALRTELQEARDQQTATAEVLQVINSSPGDLAPVFEAILEKAHILCGAVQGAMYLCDGDHFFAVAQRGHDEQFATRLREGLRGSETPTSQPLIRGEPFVHIPDLAQLGHPVARAGVELAGTRTLLSVPLRRGDALLGMIVAARREVRPFSEKEIALLENFAAQAVIAMENARLITETREALEQQTATAEVLGVINSSPGDLTPVFDTILEKAHILCEAAHGHLTIYDGDVFRIVAMHGIDAVLPLLTQPFRPEPGSLQERLLQGERLIHIPDIGIDATSPKNVRRQMAVEAGFHTVIFVPLRKDEMLVGYITAYRQEVRLFTDTQIALLQNFADQAVIAMENARLITETREALEQQTATAEVLGVINSSPGDLAPVFDAMLDKAMKLCDAAFGLLLLAETDTARTVASRNVPTPFVDFLTREPMRLDPDTFLARALQSGTEIHVADATAGEPYKKRAPLAVAAVELGGIRTMLMVPMKKDGHPIGLFTIYRQDVRPFTHEQIALIKNFAAQAVIAIENARLITETQAARDAAETALRELQTAQASLVHAQKMAALGQLTAGIAHEIKNPLNFVNNFAGLSVELLDELKETATPVFADLDDDKRGEIDETIEMLTSNLEKIAEHGQRADGIVRSMLEHSRGGSGQRRQVNLNALVDEALNLAYHGARAQDQGFNITMERDFDKALRPIEVVPQDVTRVFLNLIGNGFYAAAKRSREAIDGYRPLLQLLTRDLGEAVEVRIRDNGTGIPPEIREKLFQPFVTTKPTGEGTGLGLSISYEIVTQQHGGSIEVDSEPGSYTEFTVRLPRRSNAKGAGSSA